MKKISFSLLAFLLAFSLFAQQEEAEEPAAKDTKVILPEAGDIAIGVDATPFVNLVGNLVKINSGAAFNDPSSFSFMTNDNSIWLKYYRTKNTAYRAKIRIAHNSDVEKLYVTDDAKMEDAPADYEPAEDDVIDKRAESYTSITLGLGIEKRRGQNRLQGFYGAEGMLSYAKGSVASPNVKYKYSNDMDDDGATSYNMGSVTSRTLKVSQGGTFGIGARGFLGVEYFFAPKISVGGEFGWGFMYEMTGDTKTTIESYNAADDVVEETEAKTANGSEFDIDTDNMNGQIYLLFHL
jgi:hypothetical protein